MRLKGLASHPALTAAGLLMLLVGVRMAPLLRCLDSCFVDLDSLYPGGLGNFELVDTRLNAWILAWVQHALFTNPLALYDTNAFHPALNTLTGSEHLIGLAVLTLPVRLWTDNAILAYQATLILSSWILALSTWALARWITASSALGLVAGAIAVVMPWRTGELTHIQLLGAHWFPLVWLLALRVLRGESRRLDVLWLGVLTALQLLTSFYLAYQLTLSLAMAAACTALARRIRWDSLGHAALGLGPAYGLFLLAAIPYLKRDTAVGIPITLDPEGIRGMDLVTRTLALLVPRLEWAWAHEPSVGSRYFLPASVALLAALALGPLIAPRPGERSEPGLRAGAAFLFVCAAAAFVMSLGSRLQLGNMILSLPGYWAARVLPGYINLRAPHRWIILISIAAPILAAIGIRYAESILGTTDVRRRVVRGTAVAALLLNLPWLGVLPTRAVWEEPERVTSLYSKLASLPPGPVLEVPWPVEPVVSVTTNSHYLLASTLHWKPLLNGFTGYPPRSFHLLRRIAQELPDPEALEKLVRLADLRWIVIHHADLSPARREAWRSAIAEGRVGERYEGEDAWILEVPVGASNGSWMTALRSQDVLTKTATGLSRRALDPREVDGTITILSDLELRFRDNVGLPSPIRLRLMNQGSVPWAGLDAHPEGQVMVRYAFVDAAHELSRAAVAPIDSDVLPGQERVVAPLISPPAMDGEFELCLELVQWVTGSPWPLPVPPQALRVTVRGSRQAVQPDAAAFAVMRREGSVAPSGWMPPCGGP